MRLFEHEHAANGLEAGDSGTVVHVYPDGAAFEVEFTTLDGETVAVATVEASQVRAVKAREIAHARELSRG
jgi:Domain of unknown function (DUF4926)